MALSTLNRRQRIRFRVRKKVSGTAERPRMAIFRSNCQIYAQLIDDVAGKTLLSISSLEKEIAAAAAGINKVEQAKLVGKAVAEKSIKAGIKEVVFDRGGYLYHGRVKVLAEAAREGGLKI